MGLFQANDINAGVEEYQKTLQAKLIDVREEDEYAAGHTAGHIPASINIHLSSIEAAREEITDLDTPLFVYCRSGNRSGHAVTWLKQAGYSKVQNIGGIANYSGKTE
ncbi:rhodanese-like domain-containing protein [Lactobacillus delbrueckii subsp. bulgaricus]|nr:sulfurtransferase [Lactobacillus delbrueckii subsp. bulgaricus]MBT9002899.1 sulfurtransferase [Lactobacillus delbrueckii subsp. bulgaricus]